VRTDLGTLATDANSSDALDVNASEQVVGWADSSIGGGAPQATPFVWQNGTMTALPQVAGHWVPRAVAINDDGVIVGSDDGPGVDTQTLWANGQAYRLSSLIVQGGTGWRLAVVHDISNRGYVVGHGTSPNDGAQHGFLLEPR
jgi:uncharacterized membrane protein